MLVDAGGEGFDPVRLLGLGIADLGPPEPPQPDLFDTALAADDETDRAPRLAAVIANVQARFGAQALQRGYQGLRRPALPSAETPQSG